MSEILDFQPYLRSIRTKYDRWNRLYTPTDAEHDRSRCRDEKIDRRIGIGGIDDPMLLFEQMAEIVHPPKKESEKDGEQDGEKEGEKREIRETIGVLLGLREYARERVLLVGRPGLGKSTTLQRFLFEEAQTALEAQHPQWIPILVELRYCQGSPFDRLRASLQQHDRELHLSDADLRQELQRGRFLLLFDGLNELPLEEVRQEIRQFCQDYRQCPLVGTTRDLSLGGSFGIEKQLEMLPLNDRQMRQFVRAYLPEQAEAMLRGLEGRSHNVGQTRFEHTPLLLTMLCGVFRATGEIPANLGLLFRGFAQLHQGKLKEDVPVSDRSRHWWQPLLTHLGEYMMQADKPTEFRVAMPKTEVRREFERWLHGRVEAPGDRAAECLEDLLEHSLLQVQAGENIEFLHQLIQEYYAAEALLVQLPQLSDWELKREYLNYLKWTEPLALMLALVGDEAQALRVVRLALEVDWMLGARLAGEVKREFQEQTVGMVNGLAVPQWLKVVLLEKTRSDFAVEGLVRALEDKDSYVRWSGAEALGNLGSEAAIPGLLQALEDKDSYVRWSGVEALGKLGSEAAIPGLLRALEHEDAWVRRRAVEALGNLGSEAAIPGLLRALEDENSYVRWSAAEALGKLGLEAAIPGLLRALEHKDSWVRRSTTEALGKLGTQKVIPGLLQVLQHKDSDVRMSAALTLGNLGTEAAIPALLQALEDKDSDVRWSAVKALGNLGTQKVIPELLRALEDENSWVRRRAAEVLGNLGSEKAIPGLLRALEDENSDVRGNAAEALGNLGEDAAIPGLLRALEDENSWVRRSAVEALGKLGSEAAIPGLLRALEHKNYSVRWSAVGVLGKLGSEAAIPGLLRALEHKDSDVRGSAAEALGKLGLEAAIPGLLRALEDENYSVRRSTTEALGKLGLEAAIPGLLRALGDEDSYVRGSAAEALGKLGLEAAIPGLLRALGDEDSYVRRSAAEALGNFKKDRAAHILPNLLTLIPTKSGENAFRALTAIQANCKFYNYDIFRSPPIQKPLSSPATIQVHGDYIEGDKVDGDKVRGNKNEYNIDTLNAINSSLNFGGTIHGNQTSTQNPEPEP
jgi:HEAT repeat protein